MNTSSVAANNDLEKLSCTFGEEFLHTFIEVLQDAVEVDMIAISERRVLEEERIQVLAGSMNGEPLADMEYAACVTPCYEVIQKAKVLVIFEGAQDAYPKDEFFAAYNIESYLGIPLVTEDGELFGLVQLAWKHQTSEEEIDYIAETINTFSNRLANEIKNLHTMRILAALARGSGDEGETGAFRLLAQQIQQAFKARTVFLAECLKDTDQNFGILAYCNGGTVIPEVEGSIVPYEGTPCMSLKTNQEVRIKRGLAEAFPTQKHFKAEALDSYLGIRVNDDRGDAIGHFAILHDHPISTRRLENSLLNIFSDRFGSELRRRKTNA